MKLQLKKIPPRTALIYALLAGAYILLSDHLVALFAFNTTLMTRLQTYKGGAFVLVTAILLYFLLRSQLQTLSQEEEERQRAEASLRENEEKYRLLAENTLDIIWQMNLDLTFTYVNPAVRAITGFTPQEMVGTSLAEYASADTMQRITAIIARELDQLERHSGVVFETNLAHKDGHDIPFEIHGKILVDEQNQAVGFQGTCRDLTERHKLEAQLRQAQKLESIGQLAGGIAHDFNNMLVPIIGYAELGQMQLTPDSKIYTNLGRIKHAADRAAGLTKQILAFSRRQVLEMKTLDLNEVVTEFQEMIQRLVGENIDLKIHLTTGLPAIRADKGQLEQVLLNLAVNARDAMPSGGKLIIETAQVLLDAAYAAHHLGTQPGPRVMLAVSDTGLGMDAITQQHIFEPFFTTKGRGEGTGLGLATVFGIIKQHDGHIWVYSEPGQGTIFKIYLPLADDSETAGEAEPAQVDSVEGSETVLVVEDELTVRQLVEETLRAHGYQVLVAENGEEGVALATAHAGVLHLLLTDVVLPDMDGRVLYQMLIGQRPTLQVLYMSGYSDKAIAHHPSVEEGGAFLQKPFALQTLLTKMRAVLEKSVES